MSNPPAKQLQPWEVIAQRQTWAPDESYSAERVDECGQACVVMGLRHCSGVWTSAAYLHDLVHGAGEIVGTTFAQLQYTYSLMETRTSLLWPSSAADVRQLVEDTIARGWHLVPLRWFDHPGNVDGNGDEILHFCCITGYTPEIIQMAGPWSGTMFTESDGQFMSMYYGGMLQVQRTRKLGDH